MNKPAQLSVIVAIDAKNGIGKDNQLLASISADLKRFKAITSGHTVIMGRNTWESLPKRPLPNRRNVVITSRLLADEGAEVVGSVTEALQVTANDGEVFVMGGASVYSQMMPYANKLYLTLIHNEFEADVFFPEIDYSQWRELERVDVSDDEKVDFSYSFVTLERIE